MNTRKVYISLIAIFISHCLFAQGDQCKNEVIKLIKQLNEISFPKNKETYSIKYRSEIQYWDAEMQSSATSASILMSGSQVHFISDSYELYEDEKDAIMVMHPKKTILWTNSSFYENRNAKMKEMVSFRDTLMQYMNVISCSDFTSGGENFKKLVLAADAKLKQKLQVEKMAVTYKPASPGSKGELKKVEVFYTRQNLQKMVVFEYSEMNFNAKSTISKPAADYVVNRNNKPVTKFRGYRVIDERKNN